MSNHNQPDQKFAIVIMAAGKGTRLKSRHPKVLHEIGGRPLLLHVIKAALEVGPASDMFVVIGHEAERVQAAAQDTGVNFVLQKEQRGTGHAIMSVREAVRGYEHMLVLSGDAPMIRPETIRRIRDFHLGYRPAMTLLSAQPDDPTGYGRVVRKQVNGRDTDDIEAIIEQKQLPAEQHGRREVNSGLYAFSTRPLFAEIEKLTTDNPHGEYYLTDMAGLLNRAGERVMVLRAQDDVEILGVNTRAELAFLDGQLRKKKCDELMASGVTIYRPETCVVDADVLVGADTVIEPFVQLLGKTEIGADCRIQSFNVLIGTSIADGTLVQPGCVLERSKIGSRVSLGPFTHLRPGNEVADEAHIGNFVELKKTKIGRGSKANHLSYLGDSIVGAKVNVGAGTITCNYDGVKKHQTVIEDAAFVGSDATLVAPVTIGRGAYVAAGSCITDDVPDGSLALGRARQVNKPDWVKKKGSS